MPSPADRPTGAGSTGLTFAERVDAITPAMVRAEGGALGPTAATAFAMMVAAGADELSAAAMVLPTFGERNEVDLTDSLFALVHPELDGERIPPGRDDLADDWQTHPTALRHEWPSRRRRLLRPRRLPRQVQPRRRRSPSPVRPSRRYRPPTAETLDPKKVKAAKAATGATALTEDEKKAALEAAMEQATKKGEKTDRDDI